MNDITLFCKINESQLKNKMNDKVFCFYLCAGQCEVLVFIRVMPALMSEVHEISTGFWARNVTMPMHFRLFAVWIINHWVFYYILIQ